MLSPSRFVPLVALVIMGIRADIATAAPAWSLAPLPLAQVSLTELQATQAAREEMQAGAADAAAGRVQMSSEDASVEPIEAGGPAAGEGGGGAAGNGGIAKYLPVYALLLLFASLGGFAACRPVRRTAPDGT